MRNSKWRRTLAAAGVVAAAFGTEAGAGVQAPMTVAMDCPEVAVFVPVDYAKARALVPAEYTVVEIAPGQALLWLPIQDCTALAVNDEPLGPTPVVHLWIQVAGPEEYVQVDGLWARRDYFYSIAEHTTNNLARQLSKQLGFEGRAIERLTLGAPVPLGDGRFGRIGGVVEKILDDGSSYGYRWQEAFTPFPPMTNAIVHTFHHTKNAGMKAEADVRCLVQVYGTGVAMLAVDPRSALAPLGTTLLGQTMDLTMHCDATMWQIKK